MPKILMYAVAAVVLLIAYPLLLAAVLTVQITPGREIKDYIAIVQVALTFLTAVGMGILTAANARSTVELQAQLTQQTEDLKTRIGQIIPKEHESYHAMFRAASETIRALRAFKFGVVREDLFKRAEDAYNDAFGNSLFARDEDLRAFVGFSEQAQALRERASKLRGNSEGLERLWNEAGGDVEKRYEELRDRFVRWLNRNGVAKST